jgi:hypothetical protein
MLPFSRSPLCVYTTQSNPNAEKKSKRDWKKSTECQPPKQNPIESRFHQPFLGSASIIIIIGFLLRRLGDDDDANVKGEASAGVTPALR